MITEDNESHNIESTAVSLPESEIEGASTSLQYFSQVSEDINVEMIFWEIWIQICNL